MLGVIHDDSVYMLARARMRWGIIGDAGYAGGEHGRWQHYSVGTCRRPPDFARMLESQPSLHKSGRAITLMRPSSENGFG